MVTIRENLRPPMRQFAFRPVRRGEYLWSAAAGGNLPQTTVVVFGVHNLVVCTPTSTAPTCFRQVDSWTASDGNLLERSSRVECHPLPIGRNKRPVSPFSACNRRSIPLIYAPRVQLLHSVSHPNKNQLGTVPRQSKQRIIRRAKRDFRRQADRNVS